MAGFPPPRYALGSLPNGHRPVLGTAWSRRFTPARLGVSPRSATGVDRHQRLERAALSDGLGPADARAGLGKQQLAGVLEFIEGNLANRLSLSELAATAGLSRHHFARMFKRSTGLSPHRYVVGRRVELAKALLADTELPIAAIATECGFSHHQHLATRFSQLVGTTPSRFRRAAS